MCYNVYKLSYLTDIGKENLNNFSIPAYKDYLISVTELIKIKFITEDNNHIYNDFSQLSYDLDHY